MDNRRITVTSEGRLHLDICLQIAFTRNTKAVAYALHPELGLVLFWHHNPKNPEGIEVAVRSADGEPTADYTARREKARAGRVLAQPLPYAMDQKAALDFVWNWLQGADYGQKPGIDGSVGKGFHVHSDDWGHVGGSHYAIIGIRPVYALYGK